MGLSCAIDASSPTGRRCLAVPAVETFFCRTQERAEQPCPEGRYCRGFESAQDHACPGFARPPQLRLPTGIDGLCAQPVREGAECDASWGEPGCAVCEPGTRCFTDPRDPSRRVCLRPCASGDDCICPSADPAALDRCLIVEVPSFTSACVGCAIPGEACEPGPEGWGCCDARDTCSGGSCCRRLGAACAERTCCGGTVCASDGTCRRCGRAGDPPDAVLGCCDDLALVEGVCSVPCTEGEECSRERCPSRRGRLTCTPTEASCVVDVTAEACNGIDDDCDGRTDESIAPRACNADPGGCGRELPGTQRCERGAWTECEVRDFCRYQYNEPPLDPSAPLGFTHGPGVGLDACHWGRWLCDSSVPGGGGHPACPPGSACISNCDNDATCQPHDQTFRCGESDRWTALPCRGVLCWTAAELRSGSPPGGAQVCQ